MYVRLVVLLTAFALPMTASANSPNNKCGLQDLLRRVEVVYTTPGNEVPCEVHYHKDVEAPGEHQVLWRAENEIGYCETKASQFVDKLTGWGWSCSAADEVTTQTETDTSVAEDDLAQPE